MILVAAGFDILPALKGEDSSRLASSPADSGQRRQLPVRRSDGTGFARGTSAPVGVWCIGYPLAPCGPCHRPASSGKPDEPTWAGSLFGDGDPKPTPVFPSELCSGTTSAGLTIAVGRSKRTARIPAVNGEALRLFHR